MPRRPSRRPRCASGVEIAPPFVVQTSEGDWTGISVALWDRIAKDLRLDYEFYEDGEVDLIELVRTRRVDVGIAALTVTPEIEEKVDLTHPYLMAGLAVAVPRRPDTGSEVWRALLLFLSPRVIQATTTILVVVALVGIGIWLLERSRAPNERSIGSLEDGFWWSVVTMTTVGYGDKTPDTRIGRVVAAGWMLVSLAMLSVFTAVLASTFTAAEFKRVQGPDDLRYLEVGTVRGSSADRYLQTRGIDAAHFPFLLNALRALRRGDVEAVVYDDPTLRYAIDEFHWKDVVVEGSGFEPLFYGFALPEGSGLRERVNRALLRHAPAWRRQVGVRFVTPPEQSPPP